jgi:hypothetical protein
LKDEGGEFVFPGQARNKPFRIWAMEMVLRRMNIQAPPFTASVELPRLGGQRL